MSIRHETGTAVAVYVEDAEYLEMDIVKARRILQAVVDKHEDTLAEDSLFIDSGYSIDEIRQATRMVGQSIMNEFTGENGTSGEQYIDKETSEGLLRLSLQTDSINLSLIHNSKNLLVNEFPLENPSGKPWTGSSGFSDLRTGHTSVNVMALSTNMSYTGVKLMVRGVRWMFANMLEWRKPGTIMPEENVGKRMVLTAR